jgi:hypothetical protein
MVPEGMAGGGIIAFKTGDKVIESKAPTRDQKAMDDLSEKIARYSDELWNKPQFTKSEENQKQIASEISARKERMPWDVLTSAGLGAMAGTSPYALTNIGQGGQQGLKTAQQIEAENAADKKLAMQNALEQEKNEFTRKSGMLNNMQTTFGQMSARDIGLMNAKAANRQADALKEQQLFLKAQQIYSDSVAKAKHALWEQNKAKFNFDYDSQELNDQAVKQASSLLSPQVKTLLGLTAQTPVPNPSPNPANPAAPAPNPAAPAAPAVATPKVNTQGKFPLTVPGGTMYFNSQQELDNWKSKNKI